MKNKLDESDLDRVLVSLIALLTGLFCVLTSFSVSGYFTFYGLRCFGGLLILVDSIFDTMSPKWWQFIRLTVSSAFVAASSYRIVYGLSIVFGFN